MTICKECFWYGEPIDCPACFDIDTKECENFEAKERGEDLSQNQKNTIG